jgi:flagellar basal-body rod modification protein FlgD
MVDATNPATNPTTAAATANINSQSASLADNYNMFLNLLTTQLKNQDPLNPMDNNEFTQQLTQMTGVQQQLLTNQLLTQMISQGQAQVGGAAVGLIGKQVTMQTSNAPLVNGQATWNYNLPATATSGSLTVMDANGNIVATSTPSDLSKGDHTFAWNGKDMNGHTVADGVYTLQITAADANGAAIAATESYSGVASGIATVNGQTMLTVGAIQAPVTSVTAVTAAAAS